MATGTVFEVPTMLVTTAKLRGPSGSVLSTVTVSVSDVPCGVPAGGSSCTITSAEPFAGMSRKAGSTPARKPLSSDATNPERAGRAEIIDLERV